MMIDLIIDGRMEFPMILILIWVEDGITIGQRPQSIRIADLIRSNLLRLSIVQSTSTSISIHIAGSKIAGPNGNELKLD